MHIGMHLCMHAYRYKSAADLLLDTTPYCAHSTAADVIFAGVPMLTLPGTRMASRIAASIVARGACAHAWCAAALDSDG